MSGAPARKALPANARRAKPALASVIAAQVRTTIPSRSTFALLALAFATTALTISSPATPFGGPMFMMAGPAPDRIGGAVGFIGNIIVDHDLAASAARTAFVYTVLWIPAAAVYGVATFAADFACGAARISHARGTSLTAVALVRTAVACAPLSLFYLASCTAAFFAKCAQYGTTATAADFTLFASAALANALLLCIIVTWSAALYAIMRSSFAATLAHLVAIAYVLLGYASAYGSMGEAALLPWCASPVFHLMNVASLSAQGTALADPLVYCAASCVAAFALMHVGLRMREA